MNLKKQANMKVSNKGIELIKQFEGCRLHAYLCPAGIPTIGYGHTQGVNIDDIITQSQADSLLKKDLEKYANFVNIYHLDINQNQFDALVSFVYNLGPGNFKKSTLLRKIKNSPNDETIRKEFMKWVRAGGKVLEGLKKRRLAESNLYFS